MVLSRAKSLYRKHARFTPIAFFVLGFVFDALVLRRIDELRTLLQQAAYLVLSALLIGLELRESLGEPRVPLKGFWKHREALLHFLLGTLLNSYTIFYFKSASALTSLSFIGLLVGLLMVNEFLRFGKSQVQVHVALWSLCLVSYFAALVPIMMGAIGIVPFSCAVGATLAAFGVFAMLARPRGKGGLEFGVVTRLWVPFSSILVVFVGLYFARVLPPVPLAVTYLGIFHGVEKVGDRYLLSFQEPEWKLWESGDQTFLARPGDPIYCFAQVFSF